jgi:cytochrome c oxidase assembly factor CtaG
MHPSAEAVVLVPALVVAYVLVARAERPSRAQVVLAAAGLALIFAAFASELQPLAVHTFLWAHLLQNVVLAEWAPALLVLAVPRRVAARAAGFPLFRPFVALPVWLGTYFVWHLPWIYDYALRHPHSLLHLEHLTYLLAGICLWWPVVHGAYSAGLKALYLFAAFVLASPLGLLLALIPSAVYSFYAHAPRSWGPAPLADQQIAGVTMAVEEAVVFFTVFTVFLLRFLQEEQAHGAFEGVADGRTPPWSRADS